MGRTSGSAPLGEASPEHQSSAINTYGNDLPTPWDHLDEDLHQVLNQAARLQKLVQDAVLVGGSAAALYVGHRASYDHDRILEDLRDRFDTVLDALEREGEWVTNRVVPGKIILGELGDIEAGVRQLIRRRPLETVTYVLPTGGELTVPTQAEVLRIKAFLIVKRNQVRDYLDVAALADRYGLEDAAAVLSQIDDFYTDPDRDDVPVRSQLKRQLSQPSPKDSRTIRQLRTYKGLAEEWQDWTSTEQVLAELAELMREED